MDDDSSVCSRESGTLLKHVSLLSSEFTTKEKLSICCKPSFELRRLKNKGAILVLIWNCICVSIPYYYQKISEDDHGVEFNMQIVTLGLTLSIAGWIADVCFGRYRVMCFSMWITWVILMLATISNALAKTVDNYNGNLHSYVNGVLGITMAIGFGGFQANVIQFVFDQLHDASTNEISSFIIWYMDLLQRWVRGLPYTTMPTREVPDSREAGDV